MKHILTAVSLGAAAFLTIGANGNWNTKVVETPRGYEVGNPDAKVQLIEFVSYTCPHCAHFATEGEAPLQYGYIGPGKLRLEIRSYIRNDIDLAATMLVQCGSTKNFLRNHTMFMTRQSVWLEKAQKATQAQEAVWFNGTAAGRQSMASALGFYDMMETRGYRQTEIDKCLRDDVTAERLNANTDADSAEFGIPGTPSFAIGGKFLPAVHNWQALEQQLNTLF